MVAIGAVYLVILLVRRGATGLAMPELASIDAALDNTADGGEPNQQAADRTEP
jgi:hypothetical protein